MSLSSENCVSRGTTRCAAAWAALKLEKTPGVSLLPRGSKAEQADKAAQATTTIDKSVSHVGNVPSALLVGVDARQQLVLTHVKVVYRASDHNETNYYNTKRNRTCTSEYSFPWTEAKPRTKPW
ncbi:MAG: hypothetical protein WAW69_18330 [Polaromonas sp.]